ncbi:GTPase domain-containing protein [Methylobacter tundripaludum]|uniref:G domain-containing protein n=1 Tax=Methylobacter tundripaludum (strain ATCC BAA-1195 / DSM 17260 / SV96) TaxID=697282 RepID=G3IU75_METTV|nr:GTPase domain-containing protein [Methylobacter tundripaludum]EGW22673.1 hypothetical protein Mettu_1497 [Methylobacter tundripaludum SV96]
MAGKRRWKLWPSRIASKLNGISGVAGVGGTAMGIAGWTALAGTAIATSLMAGGAILAGGAMVHAVYKAIPPRLKRPEDFVGETIDISELENIDPPVLTLAIVGPTRAGKTTLKNRLSIKRKAVGRTQSATASIVSIPMTPPKYVAILDGGGEQFVQQFRISEAANCLCLVLDHNASDIETAIDQERLDDHANFLAQVRYHLIETKCARKKWIEILINKRDLWEKTTPQEKTYFEAFCNKEVEKWKSGNFADSVTTTSHSNEIGDDIAQLMPKIATAVRP